MSKLRSDTLEKIKRNFRKTKTFLDKLESLVYGITFVDPPVPTESEGLIVMSHSWASSAVDLIQGSGNRLFDEKTITLVEAGWHKTGGIIILFSMPINDVISEYSDLISSFCAGTEYIPKFIDGLEIQSECVLRDLDILTGGCGCNPGSFILFPYAPAFNNLLISNRYRRMFDSEVQKFESAPLVSASIAKEVFTEENYNLLRRNSILDSLVAEAKKYVPQKQKPVSRADNRSFILTTASSHGSLTHMQWVGVAG